MTSWKIFPIAAGTKRPALTGNWQDHATDNQEQIDAWVDAGHDLGVDCGASGLFVIDIDGEQGEQTALAHDLPRTYTMRTRSGGRHLYYRGIGPSTVQGLGPKVDTRGVGGYVVWDAPGYSLLDDHPPQSCPPGLLAALSTRKDVKPSAVEDLDLPVNLARARAYLEGRAPAIEGEGGNDHTYKTAVALRDLGVSDSTALDLLLEQWNEKCIPPWDTQELEEIVNHAWTYAQNEEAAWGLSDDPRDRFADVVHAGRTDDHRHDRYRLWSVSEALERPAPSWLFPGVLPARSVGIAYGPTNIGKTWLVLDQALYLATGEPGYGRDESDPQDVIYYSGEGFEDLVHNRIDAWCADHQKVPGRIERLKLLEDFPKVGDESDLHVLIEGISEKRLNPRLIVLDTYARVMASSALNENDAMDVMKFIQAAEYLKRMFGCTVLGIHHTGKDVSHGARGAGTLIDAADFAFEITADWDAHALKLRCEKMKAAPKFEPMHFEAINVAKGLVMRGLLPEEYNRLTHHDDATSLNTVMKALNKLKAHTADQAVATHVLAVELYSRAADETQEEAETAIHRLVLRLGRAKHLGLLRSSTGWNLPSMEAAP